MSSRESLAGNEHPLVVVWGDSTATPEVIGPFSSPPPGIPEDASGARYVYADTDESLQSAIVDADIVFAWNYFTSPRMLQRAMPFARRLQWIQVAGVGIERLLFPEVVSSDVTVTNGAGVYEQTMAEYATMMMLLFAKDGIRTFEDQRGHRWEFRGPRCESLVDRELVVVGAGGIGRAIGRQARALGMRSIGVARTGRPGDTDFEIIHPVSDLPDVVSSADYVLLVCPLTSDTAGLVDHEVLSRMKSSARLLNLGRGELIVEDALLDALRSGRIAGAALDVFWQEPLPADHPIWDLPNVIVSPHIAGDTGSTPEQFVDLFMDNLARWQTGERLRNVVDKSLGWAPVGG